MIQQFFIDYWMVGAWLIIGIFVGVFFKRIWQIYDSIAHTWDTIEKVQRMKAEIANCYDQMIPVQRGMNEMKSQMAGDQWNLTSFREHARLIGEYQRRLERLEQKMSRKEFGL
jgi:hypothetical protein